MNNLIYSNKQEFDKKLENMGNGGISNLHILADFDNTLTKAFVDGKRTPSLVSLLRGKEGVLGEKCSIEDTKLFETYYPIEINPNISQEEKNEKMIEWWTKSFELFIKHGLKKEDLRKIAKNDGIKLRDFTKDFLYFTDKNSIPVIIISASGIGNKSIKYFLEERGLMSENIKIISNRFDWDENGKAIAYKKPIIHSFNKSETVISKFPNINEKVKNRKNVILLGDSLGDHHMVDGFNYDNLICIGFLNYNEEELLDEYKKRYDLVITGDGDFEEVNNILNSIKGYYE